MNKIKDWPWIPIMSWIVIAIALINWIWPLITEDTAERKTKAIGRYEQIDKFPFEEGDLNNTRIFRNKITGDCLLYLGARRNRTITSIPCPEATL